MAASADREDAARDALARQLRLARQGRSMLYPFIGRSRRFEIWQHYPHNDAVDETGRWQFYFHAHDRAEKNSARHPQEHGHIHLFRRSPQGLLTHLAGLSLDARGLPLTWFATNQWVTGERWQAAESLVRGLSAFELRLRGPLAGAALWLADMVRFMPCRCARCCSSVTQRWRAIACATASTGSRPGPTAVSPSGVPFPFTGRRMLCRWLASHPVPVRKRRPS